VRHKVKTRTENQTARPRSLSPFPHLLHVRVRLLEELGGRVPLGAHVGPHALAVALRRALPGQHAADGQGEDAARNRGLLLVVVGDLGQGRIARVDDGLAGGLGRADGGAGGVADRFDGAGGGVADFLD
jgi:hypothetical protein